MVVVAAEVVCKFLSLHSVCVCVWPELLQKTRSHKHSHPLRELACRGFCVTWLVEVEVAKH